MTNYDKPLVEAGDGLEKHVRLTSVVHIRSRRRTNSRNEWALL